MKIEEIDSIALLWKKVLLSKNEEPVLLDFRNGNPKEFERYSVEIDAKRTRSTEPFFQNENMRDLMLECILELHTNYGISYRQGMLEALAPFLYLTQSPHFSIKDAKKCFHVVLAKYISLLLDNSDFLVLLRNYFTLFHTLLTFHDAEISNLFYRNSIIEETFIVPWFLTLFASKVSVQLVLKFWSLYFQEEDDGLIFFIALQIIKNERSDILQIPHWQIFEKLASLKFENEENVETIFTESIQMRNITPSIFFEEFEKSKAIWPLNPFYMTLTNEELLERIISSQRDASSRHIIVDTRNKADHRQIHTANSVHLSNNSWKKQLQYLIQGSTDPSNGVQVSLVGQSHWNEISVRQAASYLVNNLSVSYVSLALGGHSGLWKLLRKLNLESDSRNNISGNSFDIQEWAFRLQNKVEDEKFTKKNYASSIGDLFTPTSRVLKPVAIGVPLPQDTCVFLMCSRPKPKTPNFFSKISFITGPEKPVLVQTLENRPQMPFSEEMSETESHTEEKYISTSPTTTDTRASEDKNNLLSPQNFFEGYESDRTGCGEDTDEDDDDETLFEECRQIFFTCYCRMIGITYPWKLNDTESEDFEEFGDAYKASISSLKDNWISSLNQEISPRLSHKTFCVCLSLQDFPLHLEVQNPLYSLHKKLSELPLRPREHLHVVILESKDLKSLDSSEDDREKCPSFAFIRPGSNKAFVSVSLERVSRVTKRIVCDVKCLRFYLKKNPETLQAKISLPEENISERYFDFYFATSSEVEGCFRSFISVIRQAEIHKFDFQKRQADKVDYQGYTMMEV